MPSQLDDPSSVPDTNDKTNLPSSPDPPVDDTAKMAGAPRSPQSSNTRGSHSGTDTTAAFDPFPTPVSDDTPTTTRSSSTAASTSTSSSSAAPTSSTSTAPTTTSTSAIVTTPTTTSTIASSTSAASTSSIASSSSSIATTSASADTTSATSVPVVVVTFTTTNSDGNLVTGITSSANPTGTAAGSSSSGSGGGSDTNLGAIIGGVAGGVAGLIILIWLILLPLRKRAKKQKEVEWLSFGQENDHVNENSAEAVYGRGAGGSGEGKGGSVANVNEIQMDDMAHEMSQQPYHYHNVDNGAGWAAAGAAGGSAAAAGAYAHHDPYGQHQQDGYDPYYAQQQGYGGSQYQQYNMQPQQGWAGQQPGAYPQGEPWGAAPSYTSPEPSQAHGNHGLSHNLSIGSTRVGDAPAKGSQEGHGASNYGYASPSLGPQSPQHYPQHYQGHASPPANPQYYQGHPEQYAHTEQPDQRAGSPGSVGGQGRGNGGNGGLHLANP